MPRTYSSVEKIRAELAWVTETPDPNECAAVISGAVRKLDTGPERAHERLRRSSGPFAGSTTVRPAVNMDGAVLGRGDT